MVQAAPAQAIVEAGSRAEAERRAVALWRRESVPFLTRCESMGPAEPKPHAVVSSKTVHGVPVGTVNGRHLRRFFGPDRIARCSRWVSAMQRRLTLVRSGGGTPWSVYRDGALLSSHRTKGDAVYRMADEAMTM